MLTSVEFQGKDIEEAINNAAQSLGVSPEHIKFTVITVGSRGFLGIGRRKARIAVLPQENLLKQSSQNAGKPTKGKGEQSCAKERNVPKKEHDKRKNAKKEPKKELKQDEPQWDWSHVPPLPTVPAEGECWLSDDPLSAGAERIMAEVLKRMGFEAEIKAGRINNRVIVSLESADSARLIGRRGSTLEALSLVMDRMMRRNLMEGADENITVIVDVAGYRARRYSWLLGSMAAAATEVRRSKKSQQIPGLTAQEARMAYHALKPAKDIYIKFVNSGGAKNLILSPHYHHRENTKKK